MVFRDSFRQVSLGIYARFLQKFFQRFLPESFSIFLLKFLPGYSLRGFRSLTLNLLIVSSRDYPQNLFRRYLSFSLDFLQSFFIDLSKAFAEFLARFHLDSFLKRNFVDYPRRHSKTNFRKKSQQELCEQVLEKSQKEHPESRNNLRQGLWNEL